ncbi:di-heme oxidoredictase family protein [Vitiosangium sp. GDMCC 1.1324]|uniref:di-heme oxidoredictase family protein n=1 Tax=Vitiosangium sp. (strain GDMCC 1.1324) TaxID=2138576 RepID=UPI000D370C7C|nr:di-heme oxidoredictase family protein [Vitiosangium sp. GDMCC 1.1324]PTL78514.1 thiol oxidoreductase [Vitiosangium sp. GDMCC 1.1324]
MSTSKSWSGEREWLAGRRAWIASAVGLLLATSLACGPGTDVSHEDVLESTAQPATAVVPLFDSSTSLEPALVVDTPTALITRLADRARDRHARESQFQSYEHYLPLYFENRTISIEVLDRVAKGGSDITVNITSLWPLDTPDFRAFYLGQGVLTNYYFNVDMTQVDSLHYTATINYNQKANRPLQVGDRMEIEISQFLQPTVSGRANYYGTAFLYVVGQGGMVPWEGIGANLDSSPLAQTAWLGGRTTLSYSYSNEPQHLFKQMATNLAPVNAQPFVEGRRLHHTDFGDGSHSEVGNPVFTSQQNKLGPRFAARSCVGCHTNNGRALPPGASTAAVNVQFFANNAAWADLHYSINGGGQQSFRMAHDASNNNTYTVRDIPGGATVQYHFTIANASGGAVDTAAAQFTVSGGGSGGTSSYGYSVLSPPLSYVIKVGQVSGTTVTDHPLLGAALQSQSTSGSPEGNVSISSWTTTSGTFGDGTAYELRRPNYTFTGTVPANYSARLTPPLVGMGLLEAIPESSVASLEDPNDSNGDGISGRMQVVTDPQTGQQRLGRFGWKAGKARLSQQIAIALNQDMGVTTSIYPTPDCGSSQTCSAAGTELSDAELDKLVRYVSLLAVPARRNLGDAQAQQGESLFTSLGCAKCHAPTLTTSAYHPKAELRSQTIRPYTDLLLHDMGTGLADNLPEAGASGAEWRTPPLWGIGLTASVSGGEAYLHDGRARSLTEAILWHGGEANTSKESFRTQSSANRAALLKFLQSL